ncbi:hypothetical protein SPKIRA_33230 [Sphingomonas paucimobilis]|uniref:hypothetical protein n=1 Tax=Sphingomonas paucimobilis TaxID=13689 RepID=UPI0015DC1764|nr:hypothetical protein [Sphingomonas paucimobilis]BCI72493.1 hypothetical protein SPKIRA_33230 [Sphingomonas paucimobilis]
MMEDGVSESPELNIVQTVRVREVVGTVHNLELLESMVVALSAAGFDKSDIDLMASREAVLGKLPAIYADPISLAEIPDLPRRELVTRDEGTTVTGLVFGTLMPLAALGAALPVVASGGALAAVLAATAAGGAAGAGIARVVRKVILGGVGAEALERDIRGGGLVVFVRARDAAAEERAQEIMRKAGALNVHIHEIELNKRLDESPLAQIQPDPWLAT